MATKRYDFKFHCIKDADIIQRLDAQENKQQYIRQLIATDILADSLRDAFYISDPDQDTAHEQEKNYYYHTRINWFNEHCPAVGDPNYDCTGCAYFKHHKDDPYSDSGYCDAESHFEHDMENIREYFEAGGALTDYPAEFKGLKKAKLNSIYGSMLKDPFKDDVINNMLEENQ